MPRGAFFPFGDGPRRCIGEHFARAEAGIVMATLARRLVARPRLARAGRARGQGHAAPARRPAHARLRALTDPQAAAPSGTIAACLESIPARSTSAAYFADPFPLWERLRHDEPLHHDTVDDRWLLTRYDDVVEVFRDPQTYSTLPYRRIFSDVIGPDDGRDGRAGARRPPRDRRARSSSASACCATSGRWSTRSWTSCWPRRRPRGGSTSCRTSRARCRCGSSPRSWACPTGDDRFLHDTTNAVIAALAGAEPARSEGIAAYDRFAERIAGLVAERTAAPGRDLISGIARGRTAEGEALPRTEIPSFIALMLVAGGETTDRALANFLYVLHRHPEQLRAVRDDPALLEPAFTEFMRRDGVVVYEDRELVADVELHGVHLRARARSCASR